MQRVAGNAVNMSLEVRAAISPSPSVPAARCIPARHRAGLVMADVEDLLSHPLLWRGHDAGLADTPAIATGFEALDRYLPGGGWPLAGISEIFVEHYGLGELRVLMPALAALSQRAVEARKWIVWIAPPFVPYAPALVHHGVDLRRILLVHPERKKNKKMGSDPVSRKTGSDPLSAETGSDPIFLSDARDALWAVEQAIRSQSSVATLAWVREADVTALRRLQLGAEAHRCWTVLFRPPKAMSQNSPAALRFRLVPGEAWGGIRLDIHKCRGRKPRSFCL